MSSLRVYQKLLVSRFFLSEVFKFEISAPFKDLITNFANFSPFSLSISDFRFVNYMYASKVNIKCIAIFKH